MRYLKKINNSPIITNNLNYANVGQRNAIRRELTNEQKGFCAYSERFIKHTDSIDIEHFDPRKKNTLDDDYYNWYATLHYLNSHKPNIIDPYLPILSPYSPDLAVRVTYEDGLFKEVNPDDIEAKNLINFLGVNKFEVHSDRSKHITRINTLKNLCGGDDQLFVEKMIEDRDNLSFATALEHKFDLDIDSLILQSQGLQF